MNIADQIATELGVSSQQVTAAIGLLDDGATVPFIARYRKEVTRGLDDTQLRALDDRLGYLRELEDRRKTILASIREQGKLTDELAVQLQLAETKTALEDLYLPFRPKRRTKAQIAREAGLAPLAEHLLQHPERDPHEQAQAYIDEDKQVADEQAALDGARHILMEQFAEDAELLGELREYFWENATLRSQLAKGKAQEGAKFADYFDYEEAVSKIPSHRALALFRGRSESILNLAMNVNYTTEQHPCVARIARHFGVRDQQRPGDAWLQQTVNWTWKVKLHSKLEVDLNLRLREAAEQAAIEVFGRNLGDLLLAAPAGTRACLGLDPGIRTGVKVAAIDATGKLLETATIYPHPPKKQWDASIAQLATMAERHAIDLIAIGNGTASRETDRLVMELQQRHPALKLQKIVVSEAGASVYSASEYASKEFPDVDVALRGAVSIARRLQDPLAELVKIDPKSIGVGQYQHDVNQTTLSQKLGAVVEDCVNAVGVDVNTASAPLLASVSGLSASLAENVVAFRNAHGAFKNREQLKQVPRLGAKTYEQAAGFLRIHAGDNPLDRSAVHPEAYPIVERILEQTGQRVSELIGDVKRIRSLDPARFTDEHFGLPTVRDILQELEKPGRDPRPEFKTANFKEGVESLADLRPDMRLEGVVTNVTNFGAFVDIGVHQDGLVHISQLADRFVKDPHEVVAAGEVVTVKVMEVDLERRRIALSMRLGEKAPRQTAPHAKRSQSRQQQPHAAKRRPNASTQAEPTSRGAMAEAFARARK